MRPAARSSRSPASGMTRWVGFASWSSAEQPTAACTLARRKHLDPPSGRQENPRARLDLLVGRNSMTGKTFRTRSSLVAAAVALALGCGQGAQDPAAVTADQDALHKK